MGFFSDIFGTRSDWDASKYVGKVVNRRFWHRVFIDYNEMRNNGLRVAYELDPLNTRLAEPQSPKTIVGELIFLFKTCRDKGDTDATNFIVKAIIHLLDNHLEKLPKGAITTLSLECYHGDIWDWQSKKEELEKAKIVEESKKSTNDHKKKKKIMIKNAIKRNETTYMIRGKKHIFDGTEFICIEDN